MKTAPRRLCILSRLRLFLCLTLSLAMGFKSAIAASDNKLIIEERKQTLEFYLIKGALKARLIVEETVTSQSENPISYTRSIFFDNTSTVNKIFYKSGKHPKKMIKPIITNYESNGIFHSDIKIAFFDYKFKKKGETITFFYQKEYEDFKFIDPLFFSAPYPVEHSSISIVIPQWLEADIHPFNFEGKKINKEVAPEKNHKANRTIYTTDYLQEISDFKNSPQRSIYDMHLLVLPKSMTVKKQQVKLIEDVSDLYHWYANLVDEIGNDTSTLESLVKQLIAGQSSDTDKIKSIYYWVQNNIKYLAFEAGIMGFRPESCQKVLGAKYGDCKGMANLTKEMLKIAGFDARLTWLGTSDLPYTYDTPSLVADNHMICTVVLDKEKLFLDPTEKYSDFGTFSNRIEGREVLIENEDKYIVTEIPEVSPQQNKASILHESQLIGNQITGKTMHTYTGDKKTAILNTLASIPKKNQEKFLNQTTSPNHKDISLHLTNHPDFFKRDSALLLKFDHEINNHVLDLGNELYINLEMDFYLAGFELEKDRNIPYRFSGKTLTEVETVFTIPAGWKVEYLPESLDFNRDSYHFKFSYEEKDGRIYYHQSIEFKKLFLWPGEFAIWNDSLKEIKAFYADYIILKK